MCRKGNRITNAGFIFILLVLLGGCATIYIATENTKEKTGDVKETHTGATDDIIEILNDKVKKKDPDK